MRMRIKDGKIDLYSYSFFLVVADRVASAGVREKKLMSNQRKKSWADVTGTLSSPNKY